MYHVELRQFPHVVRRFNQSQHQVTALAIPWVREEWVEVDDRKWNINQAELTVLEGPQLSMPELAMGRGWRNAQRKSEDITERVLEAFKAESDAAPERTPGQRGVAEPPMSDEPAGAGGPGRPAASAPARAPEPAPASAHTDALGDRETLLADSVGLQVLALLDDAPVPLQRAWRLAEERLSGAPAPESLALAESAVGSLLSRRLIVLEPARDADPGRAVGGLAQEQIEPALRSAESWGGGEAEGAVLMRRA